MKKYLIIILSVFFSAFLITFSCKKENPDTDENDTVKTVFNEQSSSDVKNCISSASEVIGLVVINSDKQDQKNLTTECPAVSLTSGIGYPKTLTLDFGTGCTFNTQIVSGNISAVLSDRIRNDGTTVSVTLTNFKIDTLQLSGNLSLTVEESNVMTTGVIILSATLSNGVITFPSGTYEFNSTFSISWKMNTLTDYSDDLIEITSLSMTGTNSENVGFTVTLNEKLVYDTDCTEIVSGILKIETSSIPFPATINFGNGTCDGVAVVSTTIQLVIGNQTFNQDYSYTIELL